jgi:3',5'-cyclic AMP phosphodiesterase CpdA
MPRGVGAEYGRSEGKSRRIGTPPSATSPQQFAPLWQATVQSGEWYCFEITDTRTVNLVSATSDRDRNLTPKQLNAEMLLLNIADIHFRYPICNTQMDPDLPYRTMLILDARSLVKRLGSVDAILVCGDIAFAGLKEEYDAALEWLKDLSEACGCTLDRVFVAPGNHDVDRN